jgi:adenylate cyclase
MSGLPVQSTGSALAIVQTSVNWRELSLFSPQEILRTLTFDSLGQVWPKMKQRLPKAILLGIVVGTIGLLLSPFQFAMNLEEDTGLGLLFKLRGARKPPADIVVVSIDKQSSDELNLHNNPDKWPRSLHAHLTNNLVKEGAKVIAFDVHFIEPRIAEDDNLFADSIKKAQNVILCEPLIPRELPTSGNGEAIAGFHNIVKIVKPIDLFTDPAIATAPFTLPRIPFKVNRYWTFQTGAGDSPTVPVVTYQLATLSVYDEFVELLNMISPDQAEKLPPKGKEVLQTENLKQIIRAIHEIFQGDPLLELKMLTELKSSKPQTLDQQGLRSLESLIKMYGGATSRYINYYGPPRTKTKSYLSGFLKLCWLTERTVSIRFILRQMVYLSVEWRLWQAFLLISEMITRCNRSV